MSEMSGSECELTSWNGYGAQNKTKQEHCQWMFPSWGFRVYYSGVPHGTFHFKEPEIFELTTTFGPEE